jgi:hypothetical protein
VLASLTNREDVLTLVATSAFYGNLGLFIGAGFSKAVLGETSHHSVALSWGELLRAAAIRMDVDYDLISKDEGVSYPQIATKICEEHSNGKGIEFAASLSQLKTEISALTSWYPNLQQREKYSQYLQKLKPAWAITTNYDLVLESLLTGLSVPLGPSDSLLAPKGVIPVFHLHGVRTNPGEIIISQEDYVTLFRPTEYRQIKLALTIKESTTLVLGYGLGDVNVLTALDWSENVFKGDGKETYPHGVIQILRRHDAKNEPYLDKHGITIIETQELTDFFEELGLIAKHVFEVEGKKRNRIKKIAKTLDVPESPKITKFLDDPVYRRRLLKILAGSPHDVPGVFISFLNRCIDETWERAKPSGAFEAYNQNITALLDLLVSFDVTKFPPALLQTIAYNLNRVGPYVGHGSGQGWHAAETWQSRGKDVSSDLISELGNVADRYGYVSLESLISMLENP